MRFLDAIFNPLEMLVSLFAYLFWMICWAIWQLVRGVRWLIGM